MAYSKSGQGKAKAQFPYEDIYKLFMTQAIAYSYHDYNIIYNTDIGCFYSSGENFVDILPYFIKYMKKGDVNTGGEAPKKYIERFNKGSTRQVGKIWLIYIDGRKNYKGQNTLVKIDEAEFKIKKAKFDNNDELQFACMMAKILNYTQNK